jgi:hypothetical protein
MAESVMPASEVLSRLSEQAAGTMADFLSIKPGDLTLDLAKATRESDRVHLSRSIPKPSRA